MKIIEPSVEILDHLDGNEILQKLELCGRVCYKSEDKITDDSAEQFVRMLIKRGHESVLEHVAITVKFVVDRGVSHEIVRHRIASYSQESTRYCRYGDGIAVIQPPGIERGTNAYLNWYFGCQNAETAYMDMLSSGISPQIARSVLPTCVKTEIVVTAKLREWRHFLRLRMAKSAHPQIREIACKLYDQLAEIVPVVFEDLAGVRYAD